MAKPNRPTLRRLRNGRAQEKGKPASKSAPAPQDAKPGRLEAREPRSPLSLGKGHKAPLFPVVAVSATGVGGKKVLGSGGTEGRLFVLADKKARIPRCPATPKRREPAFLAKAPLGAAKKPETLRTPSGPASIELAKARRDRKGQLGRREVERLKAEIRATGESLQAIIDEKEATNEELRVANEEIQSSNEELQSTNEELETAREEFQSTNEELATLNEDLQNRNRELIQLNDDLSNLISSFHMPIVILGNDLTVRRFTPMAGRIFNLIASDVGRPISDLNPNIDFPELAEIIKVVIDSLQMREVEVQDREGRWYSLRVRPYRTAENRIEGATLVLVDIDAIRHGLIETISMMRQPTLVLSGDWGMVEANQPFYDLFQTSPSEIAGKRVFELGGGEWDCPALHTLLEVMLRESNRVENYRVDHHFGKAGRRTILFSVRRLSQPGPSKGLIILALEDMTEKNMA